MKNKGADNRETFALAAHGRRVQIFAASVTALAIAGLGAAALFQTPEAQAAPEQTQSQQTNQIQAGAETLHAGKGLSEASVVSSIPAGSLTAHFAPARLVYGCKQAGWVTTGKGMGGYTRSVCGYWNVP
jgi:hypothetical protein